MKRKENITHVINSRYKCIITMDNMILQSEELWINISLKEQAMNEIINMFRAQHQEPNRFKSTVVVLQQGRVNSTCRECNNVPKHLQGIFYEPVQVAEPNHI